LAHKAWRAGFMTFIRCADPKQQNALDELLWTFRKHSFIPHEIYTEHAQAPVLLGIDQPPPFTAGVLINLHKQLSSHLACFSRVIEIVNQEPELLQISRKNFVEYRQQGFQPARVEL